MKGNDLKNDCTKILGKLNGLFFILDDFDLNNIGLSVKDSVERSEFFACEQYISSASNSLRLAIEHFIELHSKFVNRNYE